MSTDRDLLEAAAKSAGYEVGWHGDDLYLVHESRRVCRWNPLTDDGAALRLAVKLNLDVYWMLGFGEVRAEDNQGATSAEEDVGADPGAACRRAIVRAAAAIGAAS